MHVKLACLSQTRKEINRKCLKQRKKVPMWIFVPKTDVQVGKMKQKFFY